MLREGPFYSCGLRPAVYQGKALRSLLRLTVVLLLIVISLSIPSYLSCRVAEALLFGDVHNDLRSATSAGEPLRISQQSFVGCAIGQLRVLVTVRFGRQQISFERERKPSQDL